MMTSSRAALVPIVTGCLAAIVMATACGNSASVNVAGPAITRCGVTVSGGGAPTPAAGGTGALTISAERECSWSAKSDSPWISLSGESGQGSATLTYSIPPNPNGTLRRGSVQVENQRLEISQEPAPCRFDLSPSTAELGATGGAIEVNLVAPGGCTWTMRASDGWLSPEPSTGAGAATVRLVVLPNAGTARTGNVSIGGTTLAVRQTGPSAPAPPNCSYQLAPTARTMPAGGEVFTLNVVAPAGCPWAASSDVPWITVLDGGAGAGTGTARLQAQPNGAAARTGTVRVAGEILTIQQAAGGVSNPTCTYTLAPLNRTVGAQPEEVAVEVRAAGGCAWTASSRASWITVRAPDTGIGNGSVRLAVTANPGQTARTGAVVIAGLSFTIEQAGGAAPCAYSIKPTFYNAGRGPDDPLIEVRSAGECPWTATSNANWVSIAEGGSGTGNGNVRLAVQANAGPPRTTTLTIAGEPFTLSQEGSCDATIKPDYYNAGAGPDDVTVHVKANNGCSWTSSTPVPWVTFVEGAGSGNGVVRFRVDPNSGPARNAILVIAGQRFTLTQEAPRR